MYANRPARALANASASSEATTHLATRSPSPRVCMVSFYFHPSYSGSAIQAHGLTVLLRKADIRSEILAANLTRSPRSEDMNGTPVHRLPVILRKSLQIPSFSLSLAAYLFLHRRDFDIVHAHGTYQHVIASLVCRLLGKKSILKIAMQNSDIAFQNQGRVSGRINRLLVRQFDRVVVTSQDAYRECISQGLDPTRIRFIPNGVDTEKFSPAASDEDRASLRISLGLPNRPIVCFVGIIDVRKNVDGILRVWRQVIRAGADGHLLLIGPEPTNSAGAPSEFVRDLRKYIAGEGLNDVVTFAGRVADVPSYLRASSIFVFPSRREGMPNVLLEAMASGLACVASDIGGTRDVIDHGQTGFIYSVDDEDAMAAALVDLLSDHRRAEQIGLSARQAMLDRFSLHTTVARYVDLYRELQSEKVTDKQKAEYDQAR